MERFQCGERKIKALLQTKTAMDNPRSAPKKGCGAFGGKKKGERGPVFREKGKGPDRKKKKESK